MTNALREAMEEAANLPEAAQEKIGEDLMIHIEKLRRLRAKLDKGIASLERGEGRELDIEDVIQRARAQYGRG
jgi:hypothetical protein